MGHPLLDLTLGPMPAPEVAYNPISGGFWLSWKSEAATIDIHLRDRQELRELIRAALAAAEAEREAAHTEPHAGVG